eukprot:Nk52_evm18s2340 gene=Nk52_evmTU18s2340
MNQCKRASDLLARYGIASGGRLSKVSGLKRTLYSDRGKEVTAVYLNKRLEKLKPAGGKKDSGITEEVCNQAIKELMPAYNQNFADFRSDTLTVPCLDMYKAMISAPLGDDLHYEDPATLELEKYVADLVGHEDSVFCASGTMTNNLGIRAHLNPLESVIIDGRSHVHLWECGGIAYHCQATSIALFPKEGSHGFLSAEQIDANAHEYNHHNQTTKLVVLENTMSGKIYPFEELVRIREVCDRRDMRLHCDGARLWHASEETGTSMKEFGKIFDSMSLCLSKALGAPVGSMLTGNKELIEKARHFRKLFGGSWRQSGVLAGAGLHAVKNNLPKLKEVHARTKRLEKILLQLGFQQSDSPTETNMVLVRIPENLKLKTSGGHTDLVFEDMLKFICNKYDMITPGGEVTDARFVLHHQITDDHLDLLEKATKDFIETKCVWI